MDEQQELRTWPVVLQACVRGIATGSSSMCMSALGGALWQLQRSLIDYEVISMGNFYGYVPPDDNANAVSELVVQDQQQEQENGTGKGSANTSSSTSAQTAQTQVQRQKEEQKVDDIATTAAAGAAGVVGSSNQAHQAGGLLVGGGQAEQTSMTLDAVSLSNLEILYNNFDRTSRLCP